MSLYGAQPCLLNSFPQPQLLTYANPLLRFPSTSFTFPSHPVAKDQEDTPGKQAPRVCQAPAFMQQPAISASMNAKAAAPTCAVCRRKRCHQYTVVNDNEVCTTCTFQIKHRHGISNAQPSRPFDPLKCHVQKAPKLPGIFSN